MSLRSSSQRPSGIIVKYDRLQSPIEPVTKVMVNQAADNPNIDLNIPYC